MVVDAGGAALGAAFGLALKPFEWMISKALKFKSTRTNLSSTVEHAIPVVKDIEILDKQLGRPKEEAGRVMEQLQAGKHAVTKASDVPWWKCCCLPFLQDKLEAKYERVERALGVDLQHVIARDVKEGLVRVKGSDGYKDSCKPPPKPDFTVGLDIHLHKLKKELLQKGKSVIAVTGLAGSGKTTLATLLCWDEEVKGKFGDNILFVTVSKTPNLMATVQTLFQCRGIMNVPDLINNKNAIIQLRILLEKIGENPIMLVLDDVWHGSETLIEETFKVHLSDYKILVTSRVQFPRFGPASCQLKELGPEDAVTLFRHFALLNDRKSYNPNEDIIQQVGRGCWGSPLALELVGRSLCGQPKEAWEKIKKILLSKGRSIVSNTDLLNCLHKYLDDVLEDKAILKECFMDLGLFPEDRKIPVAALIDIWTELHKLDDGDIDAMNNVFELIRRHLVDLIVTREVVSGVDNYNHHFLMQHDLLREIAVHQARQEPYEQRKRLIFDINENNWPLQNQQQAVAHTLSISTDEMNTPDWCNMLPSEVFEVMVLNLRTNKYTLPVFMKKMSTLKVLIVTNYNGFHFSELNNSEILSSLSSLKRIRFQQVSVPPLGKLINLRKLSLYMCDTSQVFQNDTIQISDALPNLEELSIDYSKDLVELPSKLCKITTLKKLSITKCGKFSVLPQEIGNLVKLEMLILSSCSVLRVIPPSIGKLGVLGYLDISYCVSLKNLPEEFVDLGNLEKLYMINCSRCKLPRSVKKLKHLRSLICDAETAASWNYFKDGLPNLVIKENNENVLLFI